MILCVYNLTADTDEHLLRWFEKEHPEPDFGDVVFIRSRTGGRVYFGIHDGAKMCTLFNGMEWHFGGPYVVPAHICAKIPNAREFFSRDYASIDAKRLFVVK